ncbi:MAG: FliM/FliN family flagellar motor switch protein [Ferrimicrobium sp.]
MNFGMSGERVERVSKRSVQPVDFRLPRSFERNQLRGVELLIGSLTRPAASLLGATLRHSVKIEVLELQQVAWESVLGQLERLGLVVTFGLLPLPSRAVLHLSTTAALRILDLRLGGDATEEIEPRSLSELEKGMLAAIFSDVVDQLGSAISTQLPVQVDRLSTEPSIEFIQSIPMSEMCVLVQLRLQVADIIDTVLSLVLPYSMLRPVVEIIVNRAIIVADVGSGFQDALRARLNEVCLTVRVRFRPTTISSQRVLELVPGDLISLGHRQGRPLSVVVDHVELYQAVLGQSGSRVSAVVVKED